MSLPVTFYLPHTNPEAQGISSTEIADFVATAEKMIYSLHSFILMRHGSVAAEGWCYP
jgi:hypothetical protein